MIRNGDDIRADQAGRGGVRADLRRRPPGSRRSARLRHLRRLQRLLAASALERIRLRGSFLTEDIEASMRVLAGRRPDRQRPGPGQPRARSRQRSSALWRQRMRWAQGWFQVSLPTPRPVTDLAVALAAPEARRDLPARLARALPVDRDAGLAADRLPGLARRRHSTSTSPIFTLATLFIAGLRSARRRWPPGGWPRRSCAGTRGGSSAPRSANLFFYTELKNLIARVAHLKQLRGEHQWVVTPRTAPAPRPPTRPPRAGQEVAA